MIFSGIQFISQLPFNQSIKFRGKLSNHFKRTIL